MKPRTLAVVAALALGLAAFIAFYERDLPSSDERRQGAKRVLTVDKKQVDEVIIERRTSTAETIRLLRTAGAAAAADGDRCRRSDDSDFALTPTGQPIWRLEKPLQARADGWAIDRLLDSLISLDSQRRLEDPDRAGLGLDAPRVVVTLRGTFGERVLEVGAALPVGNAMAVAVRGEDSAAIVSDAVFAELAKPSRRLAQSRGFRRRSRGSSLDRSRTRRRAGLARARRRGLSRGRPVRRSGRSRQGQRAALRTRVASRPELRRARPSEVNRGSANAPWIEVTSAVAAGALRRLPPRRRRSTSNSGATVSAADRGGAAGGSGPGQRTTLRPGRRRDHRSRHRVGSHPRDSGRDLALAGVERGGDFSDRGRRVGRAKAGR